MYPLFSLFPSSVGFQPRKDKVIELPVCARHLWPMCAIIPAQYMADCCTKYLHLPADLNVHTKPHTICLLTSSLSLFASRFTYDTVQLLIPVLG